METTGVTGGGGGSAALFETLESFLSRILQGDSSFLRGLRLPVLLLFPLAPVCC